MPVMAASGRVVFKFIKNRPDGTPEGAVLIEYFGDDPRTDVVDEPLTPAEARELADARGFPLVEED
jgi:hypothetical protein